MQEHVSSIIAHMAKSHAEMARLLEAKRHSIVKTAQMVVVLPSENPGFDGVEGITKNAMDVTKNITAYLNGVADLIDAVADNLEMVVKELSASEEEE